MLLVFRVCHYHGPAGKGTRHLDYRAKTAVDRSERKHRVAVMPAMPEGQPEPTLPDVAVTDAAVAVGTSEKREVTGVSRLAPVVTPVVNNGLDVAGAQVTRPAARTWRSFGFLRYSPRDLKSHAGGKPYTLGYPGRGQRDKESGSTGLPQVRDNGMERVSRRAGGPNHLFGCLSCSTMERIRIWAT